MGITKESFEKIRHLLPVVRGNGKIDSFTTLNAMLHIAENGYKWRALPKEFGNWHTIYMKINRWAKSGVLEKIFCELRNTSADTMFLDATIVKVHPHGTGALKKTGNSALENPKADSPQKYISLLQANAKRLK